MKNRSSIDRKGEVHNKDGSSGRSRLSDNEYSDNDLEEEICMSY
jgi:hypothetical protein